MASGGCRRVNSSLTSIAYAPRPRVKGCAVLRGRHLMPGEEADGTCAVPHTTAGGEGAQSVPPLLPDPYRPRPLSLLEGALLEGALFEGALSGGPLSGGRGSEQAVGPPGEAVGSLKRAVGVPETPAGVPVAAVGVPDDERGTHGPSVPRSGTAAPSALPRSRPGRRHGRRGDPRRRAHRLLPGLHGPGGRACRPGRHPVRDRLRHQDVHRPAAGRDGRPRGRPLRRPDRPLPAGRCRPRVPARAADHPAAPRHPHLGAATAARRVHPGGGAPVVHRPVRLLRALAPVARVPRTPVRGTLGTQVRY